MLILILLSVCLPWILGHPHTEKCSSTNKYCQPEQVHIAFGEKINDITVTWSTMNDTAESVVQFGEKSANSKATGNRKLFVDGGPLKRRQWIHNVALKDLKHDSTYVYKVGSKHGWSELFSFTTPPAGEHNVVRAIVYGDMGSTNDHTSKNILKEMKSNRFDFIIHNGDYAYDLGTDNAQVGNDFMNMIQKIAANIPYMTSPGNHEGGYNFSNYKNRFSMPGNTESMFYSYNIGPIHFVAIDTEVYYGWQNKPRHSKGVEEVTSMHGPTKEELQTHYNWLKADLEEANKKENREKRPWIILYGHRPMYCSVEDDGCRDGTKDHPLPLRVGIPKFGGLGAELLLKDYGVDLVIWAHEHSYERTFPLYDEKVYNGSDDKPYVNPGAPVHITSGAAGNREPQSISLQPPSPWSAFRSSDYGYMRMFVYNHTHLYMEAMSTQHVDGSSPASLGEEDKAKKIDEFWLIKDEHKPYEIPS